MRHGARDLALGAAKARAQGVNPVRILLSAAASLLVLTMTGAAPVLWGDLPEPLVLRENDAPKRVLPGLAKGSHVKVFIPSLSHIYTAHSINDAPIKPSGNAHGWEYDMATSHSQIDAKTYEFALRKGVRFQDRSPFNADAVVSNMEHFKKAPYKITTIDKVFVRAEKIDDFRVRFLLNEPYGSFMHDIMWMPFYTEAYLKTNPGGWNGKTTCPNLSMPEMGGFEATEAIRAGEAPGGRRMPIVALTAHAMAGFDDYLSKPIHAAALDDVLARVTAAERAGMSEPGGFLLAIGDARRGERTILAFWFRAGHDAFAANEFLPDPKSRREPIRNLALVR